MPGHLARPLDMLFYFSKLSCVIDIIDKATEAHEVK